MVPYTYDKESYFETGYILEGITTYYGDLLLARSGVFSWQQYKDELNTLLKRHFENYGRFALSLAESSFDLWVDGYKQGIPNRKVSIYVKGALVSLIFDLHIRHNTQNQKSLDDVINILWKHFGNEKLGYTSFDFKQILEKVSGVNFDVLFEKLIYGNQCIADELEKALRWFGLSLNKKAHEEEITREYGLKILQNKIVAIAPNSPSWGKVSVNDEVVSVISSDAGIDIEVKAFGVQKKVFIPDSIHTYFDTFEIEVLNDDYLKWIH